MLTALLLLVSFYYVSPTFQRTVKDSVENIQKFDAGNVETSLGYRLSFAKLSLHLIQERPVLGYGTEVLPRLTCKPAVFPAGKD